MEEIDVKLGKYAIAGSGLLKINRISSGVSVMLYSTQHKIGAALHILASHSGPRAPQNPIMYANTAIPFIMEQLRIKGVKPPFSVAIAGGAVLPGAHGISHIGPAIVKAVRTALADEGLKIKIDKTGTNQIRSMILNVDAGKIKID